MVVAQGLWVEAQPVTAEVVRVRRGADQPEPFPEGLGKEEPVPIDDAELLVHAPPHFSGWDDAQHRKAVDSSGESSASR
jgi:hypothetical protein